MKKLAIIMKVIALISLAMFLGGGCEEEPLGDEATIGGAQNGGTTDGNTTNGGITNKPANGNTAEEETTNGGGSTSDNVDDEVTACFNLVNEFRTGNEAFYLNKDNTTTTNLVGELGKLTLDEELCKAAAIRAEEIVKSFSHTRPDGKGSCFTVLEECGISYTSPGENIAAGTNASTGESAFKMWKEDGEPYSGQGHRRNMLGNFTKIGIAYTYAPDSKYKYYWVMILIK